MKRALFLPATVTLLAFIFTGCESTNIAGRIREKPDVYAKLQPAEKEKIDHGVVALGFDADMVYLAMGHPSKVEPVEGSDGRAELWTYRNYYPSMDAASLRHADYRTETPYQPSRTYSGTNVPVGTRRQGSSGTIGGPQGGSIEPADLQAFTLRILFQDGKVKRLGIGPD
jgi:hypothetical protein